MPVYYLYVYSPSDFVTGLPDEFAAAAAGSPTFTLELVPGAVPTVIAVNDNDTIFDEIDGSQILDADVTIDGDFYAAGTSVHSAYDLINTTTGHQVTSLHMGGNGYQQGAVDGLISSIEMVPGTSYTFNVERTSHRQDNSFEDYVACFVSGTRLETPGGPVAIEDLKVGDIVTTLDGGDLPLRWVGQRTVEGHGALAPIRIPEGWNGLHNDLYVSPQHRMMIGGASCALATGHESAFLSARQLVTLGLAEVEAREFVTYHHIMFDEHQVVIAEGAASESMLASDMTLQGFAGQAAEEIRSLFPDLPGDPMTPARPVLRSHEVRVALA